MKELFIERLKEYFNDDADVFINKMNELYTQGFFINTNKADREKIFDLVDFDYKETLLSNDSFYHFNDNIGKTKAYELGLIYPQELAASLSSNYINKKNIRTVVDMCSAPGGKTINVLNRLNKDILCISNDINHNRALILSSNLERLGLDNVIVTNKDTKVLADHLENFADLVILDAPCSGEGMIRKYPEILDEYSLENIRHLAKIQKNLLEDAYRILKGDGLLIYSTCTYAFEEDEDQVRQFLESHKDMRLVKLEDIGSSKLDGTIKFSILNNTEGQFIAYMKKNSNNLLPQVEYLKPIKNKLVNEFLQDNLSLNDYYLYEYNNRFYMSLTPLFDMNNSVLRYGIYVGEIKKIRFEPSHCLYRSNSLRPYFKHIYQLNDEEYDKYIQGLQLKASLDNKHYLLTYKNHSLGFGKCVNGIIKNKYPKGLRRVI